MKTAFYVILMMIGSGTLIFFAMLISDWNHKRRLHDAIGWIIHYNNSESDLSFAYKHKFFRVSADKINLLNPYTNGNENHTMIADCYRVYINGILVMVMNRVDTCGPNYRFIKYLSDYDNSEIDKIILKAARVYKKRMFAVTHNETKSFFR